LPQEVSPLLRAVEQPKWVALILEYVFPGQKEGKPLSSMAMLMLLRRMDRTDLTAHGFRSTFRDWAEEATSTPHAVSEAALAHTIGNKVEAAYRRGDLFQKRAALMQEWADYCAKAPAEVVAMVPVVMTSTSRA
jgi:integrase